MTEQPKTSPRTGWLPFFFIFLQSALYGFGDPISKAAL